MGIAKILPVDRYFLLLVNYVYEYASFCTSLIVKMDNGTIVHLRNLDFPFRDYIKNLTYIAKFYDGD